MERPGITSRETTVLIVDDDPNNLAMLASFLGEHDLNILVAEDSVNALQRAIYTKPDLILLDIRMPKMNGYELCRRLKEIEETRDIPVIFMTALMETEYKVKGFEAGAVDYVTKPFQREEVLARVSIHLHNRELTHKLQEEKDLLEKRVEERTRALKAAHEKRGELEFIINHSPAVAWLWKNEKGWPVEYVSENLAIYGYTPEDFIDGKMVFASIVHPADLPRVAAEIERYTEEGQAKFTLEYRILTKSGEVRWLDGGTWVRQNTEGIPTHFQGITVDITQRKQAEEELRKAQGDLQKFNEQLEQMVIDRTEELQRVNQELERAREAAQASSRAKGDFLASMSHEIRTPLTAILGFSQLLKREKLTASAEQKIDIISQSGEHLLSIINDVLELAKIESGRINLNSTPFAIEKLITDLEMLFRERIEQKGLRLVASIHPETPKYMIADEGKIRQIFINLIGNAIKFTEKGAITIRICPQAFDGSGLRIAAEVEDTGEGIAPGEMDLLFEAFEQTTSGIRSNQGTGLGLAITREYLHVMGGDISVKSKQGVGSCFSFRFPVQTAQEPAVEKLQEVQITGLKGDQGTKRVLVVDDHEEQRKLIAATIGSLGVEIKEAANGMEAIRIHGRWHPDIILMDLDMPEINGYQAVRKIREVDGETFIIAVTANVLKDERHKVIAAGFNYFVQKPFRGEEIIKAIETGDIQFRRAGEEQFTREAARISSSTIPAELLLEIRQAAGKAEIEKLTQLCREVEAKDSFVGKKLKEMLMRFDYETIIHWATH